jgi:hypothetical protein
MRPAFVCNVKEKQKAAKIDSLLLYKLNPGNYFLMTVRFNAPCSVNILTR